MKNKKLFAILTLLCFMMTLMPVAAFAADASINAGESSVFTKDTNVSKKIDSTVNIQFDFEAVGSGSVTTGDVYVWFVKDSADVASLNASSSAAGVTALDNGVFKIEGAKEGTSYGFTFSNSGNYTVKAALENPNEASGDSLAEKFRNVDNKLSNVTDQSVIKITASTTSSKYAISVSDATVATGYTSYEGTGNQAGYYTDGVVFNLDQDIQATNVMGSAITVTVVDENGKAVKGETVTFDTNSSNIELNKEKATTNTLGQVTFKIAGAKDGDYKVYVKCGSYEATINVTVGSTAASTITLVKSPSAPIDITSDLDDTIQFTFADANGNAVKAAKAATSGATNAFDADTAYVAIVSQPSASDLENADFYLVTDSDNAYKANLAVADELVEGTYTIKVVLDNGKYTTVTFEVKEFATPVALNLVYEADAVELGSSVDIDTLEWVDANGVTKKCTGKVDLAATGYAVSNFDTSTGKITVKTDDKYVGSTITVVAVDDRYNLTAQATITVADEASELAFDTKTLAIDTNNKVGVSVVDSNGNKVALNRGADATATISYVILDKPEGAKVSVSTDGSDNNILTEGTFKMNVTSNTVGNVTIQAVAKVSYTDTDSQSTVVRYYTGTQIFAVGTESTGQVVVMSIGSNEIVINDAKSSIDAAPMIQNDRTYVPFRALAEAFGATVAYDEATQAVTAELNGVTVVMTIGSATYTVNGAEKTMDVAPFISGSRTMIPVRFVAEAFGIKVIPTYDQNGATADILFNL